jgi:hypothetical protein
LVVDGWVESRFTADLAASGLDDVDVETVDHHQDGGSGVGSSDTDVVRPARVAEREGAAVNTLRRTREGVQIVVSDQYERDLNSRALDSRHQRTPDRSVCESSPAERS